MLAPPLGSSDWCTRLELMSGAVCKNYLNLTRHLKGDIGCKIQFYMVFAYNCVLTEPPYIDELFQNLNSFNYQAAWFSKQFDVKLLKPRPRLLTDCPVLAYFRPQPVCSMSTIFSTLKQLKWQQCLISNAGGFEIGCKSEHKNLNFSESLRAQWISFVFDGNVGRWVNNDRIFIFGMNYPFNYFFKQLYPAILYQNPLSGSIFKLFQAT